MDRGGLRRWLHSRRMVVVDRSMVPTLLPGDRLRVDTAAYRAGLPAIGDVVVLADPERRVRWLVKRVHAIDPGRGSIEVRGDGAESGRDSSRFGPVPRDAIVGRVYRVYYPPERGREL